MKYKIISLWIVILALCSYLTYASCSNLNNAQAYYSMDDDCITDSTTNNYDGTNSGADHNTSGLINGSCEFIRANSDTVNVSPLAGAWVNNGGTICGWAKQRTHVAWFSMFDIGNNNPGGANTEAFITIRAWDDNFMNANIYDGGSSNIVADDVDMSSNVDWHHYCIMWDSNGHIDYFYFDGVNQGASSTNTFTLDDLDQATLGAHTWRDSYNDYWDGTLDEVGFWTTILTSDNVSQLYNSGNGCNPFSDAVVASFTLNKGLPNDNSQHTESLSFWFNGTVTNTDKTNFNCTFKQDNTLVFNQSISDITINNNFTLDYECLFCNYTIDCSNTNTSDSISWQTITTDFTEPFINISQPISTSEWFYDTDYSFNVTLNDTNLDGYNISFYENNSGVLTLKQNFYLSNMTGGWYVIDNTTNSSTWCTNSCSVYMNVTSWDSHNPVYKPHKKYNELFIDKGFMHIKFDNYFIELNSNKVKKYEILDQNNKYEIQFEFSQKDNIDFDVYSNTEFYFKKSEYKGHFVFPSILKFLDFESEDLELVNLTQISPVHWKIVFNSNKLKIKTKSIGDLHVNSDKVLFDIVYRYSVTEQSLLDINETNTQILNNTNTLVTLVDEIEENITMLPIVLLYGILLGIGYFAIQSGNFWFGIPYIIATTGFNFYFWQYWESDPTKIVLGIVFGGLSLLSILSMFVVKGTYKNRIR